MDREDIIKMVLEAHGPITDKWWDMDVAALKRFAALVAKQYSSKHASLWLKRIDEAVKAEREACAKVLDDMAAQDRHTNYYVVAANAIRARGETK